MKISIIGIGRVGSTLAYIVASRGLCNELVLVNRRHEIALGDAFDLMHTLPFLTRIIHIHAGDIQATHGSDIIAICASVPMKGDILDRNDLASGNIKLFESMIPSLVEYSPKARIVIISNPVDVLTYHTLKITNLPASQVMGTGTLIDSARFRALLSQELSIHADDLRAYILGEHGSHQFPALSRAFSGGEIIEDNERRRQLFRDTVEAGFKVYRYKGYTNYAVATAAAAVIEAIAFDTCRIMPLSVLIDGFVDVRDVCLSLPVVVGVHGILRTLHPQLNDEEKDAFKSAAKKVQEVYRMSTSTSH